MMRWFLLFLLMGVSFMATAKSQEIMLSPTQKHFSIELVSNPTTGYLWSVSAMDKNKLCYDDPKYQAPNSKMMGAPGHTKFTFKILTPKTFKQTSVTFSYARPWEKAVVKTETYIIKYLESDA